MFSSTCTGEALFSHCNCIHAFLLVAIGWVVSIMQNVARETMEFGFHETTGWRVACLANRIIACNALWLWQMCLFSLFALFYLRNESVRRIYVPFSPLLQRGS